MFAMREGVAMAAGSAAGSDGRSAVLAAYARALGRETHVLARSPELTWQQLHNRLQWEGEEVEARLAPNGSGEAARRPHRGCDRQPRFGNRRRSCAP
jgi:hypothetical protein